MLSKKNPNVSEKLQNYNTTANHLWNAISVGKHGASLII